MFGDEGAVRALYKRLLSCWNDRSAADFAALFVADGHIVGFDGSQVDGSAAIVAHLGQIFADHPTAAYVARVREVRSLGADAALLRAVAGMIPPGQSDLNPAVNAVQTLAAVREGGQWRVVLFQSTPAAFHGRPDLVEELTRELRQIVETSREGAQ